MKKFLQKVSKLLAIVRVSAWRVALFRGHVAAGTEHARVLAQLNGCLTVVDVGANRGQFALVARSCFPTARIISFEPLWEPAKKFRSIFAGDMDTELHQVAIGPEEGQATIHLSARDDSSSLLPIASAQSALFPGTAEVGKATIKVGTLANYVREDLIKSPALLKLDVQGFELQALMGCESQLDYFSWIYVECSFVELYAGQAFADAVITWLKEHGFALRGVYHMVYDNVGRAVQADFLFGR